MVAHWIKLVLIVAWCAAMWVGVIIAAKRAWGPYLRSKRQDKTSLQARVKAKQGRQEMNPVTWQPEFIQKVLVFECEDGVERDYEVHDDVYDWVDEGDDGLLVYQGELFVSFDARRGRENLDKILDQMTRR